MTKYSRSQKGSDDGVCHSELLGFWTLSIIRYSKKRENTTFRNLDLFPSSEIFLRDPTEQMSTPISSEDENRSRFRNVVSSRVLEYRKMDNI
jgi:hypothetical protein